MRGGMLSPDFEEPDKPFSYFWNSSEVIGSLFGRVATEVGPEEYLYTGARRTYVPRRESTGTGPRANQDAAHIEHDIRSS